uniref:Metallophos domain-containing protein n=1 Tax=Haemonchus placei TaxID=6290 RepID=A0A0N4X6S3_HAEPC
LYRIILAAATSSECQQCRYAVELLHDAWGDKITEECDEFIYVLGQIIVEPHQICGLLLDGELVLAGKPTLRALHLTDIHLDMYYTPGLEAQCSEPLCCRPQQDPNVEGNADVQKPAGPWGTVGSCDTPYWLFTNMLQFIQKNHKDLDYVMVSGDLVSHAVWDYSRDAHVAMVKNISDTIRMYFPNIPTYFAVGNHEGVPIDNFAPHFTPKKFHMDWLYDAMADAWNGWVPDDQVKTVKYMGCYMKQIYPGLRLISINNALGGDAVNFSSSELFESMTESANFLKELYPGLKSQAPSEWSNMIERMKTDDVLFEKYRENYYRRSKYDGIGNCNDSCKKGWLCSARQLHHSNTLCADLGSISKSLPIFQPSSKGRVETAIAANQNQLI